MIYVGTDFFMCNKHVLNVREALCVELCAFRHLELRKVSHGFMIADLVICGCTDC